MEAANWQSLFNLVSSIGSGPSLEDVLLPFQAEWSRQWEGTASGAFFLRIGQKGQQTLYPVCLYPSASHTEETFAKVLSGLPQNLSHMEWEKFRLSLPKSEQIRQDWATILEITGFGVMVFVHRQPVPFLSELETVARLSESVGRACTSWLQFSQLQEFQSKIAGINKKLREKTIQIEKSQRALAESEAKYRSIFENIQDVFFQTDPHGRIMEINPAITRYSEYTREELLGQNARLYFADGGQYEEFNHRLRVTGELSDYEIIMRNRNGRIVHASINAHLLYGMDNEVLGVEGTIRDITERIQAADKLKAMHHRLLAILEHLQSAILVEDHSGKVILVNREYLNMFNLGEATERLIGKPSPDGARLAHTLTHHQAYDNFVRECFSSHRAILNRRMNLRGGRVIECDYIPISEGAQTQRLGIVWQFRDVTESIRAAEELKHAKDQAEAANRAKSEFLANMSHEIRTPLNAIIGFSELLEQRPLQLEEKNYAEAIGSSGRNLLRLINDILDLSKIEAGALELNPNPVDLRSLFTEILDIFQLKARSKRLDLSLAIDDLVPPLLYLDETRFRQILFNLVGNAMKFTDEGEIALKVRTNYPTLKETVDLQVEISDTGIGIEQDQLAEIFQTFMQQRGQDAHKYSGSGLGLSITKRLVEAMGGSINVFSSRGKGSVFLFTIPNLAPADGQRKEKANADSFYRFHPERVMVVEDNPTNAQLMQVFLQEFNLESQHLLNGEEILDQVLAYKPALILMDIHMPIVDGLISTRLLRQHPDTAKIPIVAVTADALSTKRQEALEAGVDALITKPFTKTGLNKVLVRFLAVEEMEPEPAVIEKQLLVTHSLKLDKIGETWAYLNGPMRKRWTDISSTMLVHEIKDFGREV
ncbi:MAG: PAS domain S-box protein, partial [Acidobacteria bacterium]|nr:PAS domain S-box protein [Acidobacteriota bacterium]